VATACGRNLLAAIVPRVALTSGPITDACRAESKGFRYGEAQRRCGRLVRIGTSFLFGGFEL